MSTISLRPIDTGSASVTKRAVPRRALHRPSVATNDGTSKQARNTPATEPIKAPNPMARTKPIGVGTPHCSRKARATDVKATMGPTLTSISPAMITSVAAQAAIPIVAASRRMLIWLLKLMKPPAVAANTRYRMPIATNRLISFIRILRRPSGCAVGSSVALLGFRTSGISVIDRRSRQP